MLLKANSSKLFSKAVPTLLAGVLVSPQALIKIYLQMKKIRLLHELADNTMVVLKPSPVEGIGVFALTTIQKGQRNIFSNDASEWIKVSKSEVEQLPQHSRALVENFCLYDLDNYFVPEYGFKMIDLVIYLNHSDDPNIVSINEGENFEALRDIAVGEELFVDYGEIVAL